MHKIFHLFVSSLKLSQIVHDNIHLDAKSSNVVPFYGDCGTLTTLLCTEKKKKTNFPLFNTVEMRFDKAKY